MKAVGYLILTTIATGLWIYCATLYGWKIIFIALMKIFVLIGFICLIYYLTIYRR